MKSELIARIGNIVDHHLNIKSIDYVPDKDEDKLLSSNIGLEFTATVLYLDIRDSTKILEIQGRETLAKLYEAYHQLVLTVVKDHGGRVRSFPRDGIVVFFPGSTKKTLSEAVKAALKIKYLLAQEEQIKSKFESLSRLNFAIGIDHGKVLCTKLHHYTPSHDLIWIGPVMNKAIKLVDRLTSPRHIGISSVVYENLLDEVKIHKDTSFGYERKLNMWQANWFTYNNKTEKYFNTSYFWDVH